MDYFNNIVQNVYTFDDFDNNLKNLSKNDKGIFFEIFCKFYFKLLPNNYNKEKIYLYNEIPLKLKIDLKLDKIDKGIDLIIYDNNDNIYTIQCKYKSDKSKVPFGKLATFCASTYAFDLEVNGAILFTNSYDVCDKLKNDKYINITYSSFDKCNTLFWSNVRNSLNNKKIIKYINLKPLNHHIPIINKLEKYYKDNDFGILNLACGSGKTFLGFWLYKYILKCNKVFIAVPSLYLLSQTYEFWLNELQYEDDIHFILIASRIDNKEGYLNEYKPSTNKEKIKDELLNNNKVIVITTYQSSNILLNICKENNYKFGLGIYDESHKTVGDINKDYSVLLSYNKLSKKRLFMTATQKIYDINNSLLSSEENNNILSMDDKEIYGDEIYNYSVKSAIKDKVLVDYKIIAPFIYSSKYNDIVNKNKFINSNNHTYKARNILISIMVLQSIKEYNIKHMLIFSNNIINSQEINNILNYFINKNDLNINCVHLNGNNSMNIRKKEVKIFEISNCSIICSCSHC